MTRIMVPLMVLPAAIATAADNYPAREYQAHASGDSQVVRDRWLDLETLRAADPELDSVKQAVDLITRAARGLVDRQITDPNDEHYGSFGEIKALTDRHIAYDGGYYSKPRALARAYACPHGELYEDPDVAEALNAALEFGARFYKTGGERPNNWWAWDIGATSRINSALLLAGDAVEPELREHYMQAMYWQGNHPVVLGFEKPGTGANAIWIGGNALRLAMLSGDEELMKRGAEIFGTIARVDGPKGDGIMPDGSFHQHGNGINMGYGAAMLGDVTKYMYLTAGTGFALPEHSIDAMTRFFRDYAVWDSYKGKFNPYSSGRAATRPGAYRSSAAARAAVLFLDAGLAPARDAALSTLNDYVGGDIDGLLNVVPALSASLSEHLKSVRKAKPASGVRAYPYSDMIVSRSDAHFLSVRLACDTKGWFSIANENLTAQQVGEGSVVLMTDGRELEADTQYNRPWDRLMGVTRCDSLARKRETVSQSRMIGCASTSNAGLIAADYELTTDAGSLTGKKSYLTFGNMLVMLGSGLTSTLDEPLSTTLLALPIRDDVASAPLYHRGAGVVVLDGTAVAAPETLRVTGTTVNQLNGPADEFQNEYLMVTARSDPGEPHEYAALVVAGVSEKHYARIAKSPPVNVTRRSGLHGAVLPDGSAGAVAAFRGGTSDAGGISAPGGLVWGRSGKNVEIVLSRRNVEEERVTITVPLDLASVSEGTLTRAASGESAIELDVAGGYIVEVRITARVRQ